MKPKTAFIVSISRGFVISGIFILVLPLIFNADSIWFSMPLTEFLVSIYRVIMIVYFTKRLGKEDEKQINKNKEDY